MNWGRGATVQPVTMWHMYFVYLFWYDFHGTLCRARHTVGA